MGRIKYGHTEGPGRGKEIKATKNLYLHNRGAHFVLMSAAGKGPLATICASADTNIFGWAESPKQTTGKHSWKSADDKKDTLFVIQAADSDVFACPVDETKASINASYIGYGMKVVNVGATHSMIQKVKRVNSANMIASPLELVDVDTSIDGAPVAYVRVKPSARDTAFK